MNEKNAPKTQLAARENPRRAVPAADLRANARPVLPEWGPVPREGELCPYSGLSRTCILELIHARKSNKFTPPVKSVMVRITGNIRGRRLVSIPSLLSFLEREATKQAKLKPAA